MIGGVIESRQNDFKINFVSKSKIFFIKNTQGYYITPTYSVRSGISKIINIEKPYEIIIPKYFCHKSFTKVFAKNKFKKTYYDINFKNFKPEKANLFEKLKKNKNKKILILVNYFGLTKIDDLIKTIKKLYPHIVIIYDSAHNLAEIKKSSHIADYEVFSLRKFLPLPSGGFIISKKKIDFRYSVLKEEINLYKKASILKIKNKKNIKKNDYYLKLFEKIDLYKKNLKRFPNLLVFNRFDKFNLNKIFLRRKKNYNFLYFNLKNIKFISLPKKFLFNKFFSPLNFPLFIKDKDKRNSLLNFLKSKKIYCSVYWIKDDIKIKDKLNFLNSCKKNILNIPIDQRYNTKDMKKILLNIKYFINSNV